MTRITARSVILAGTAATLAACTSLTGLDGGSSYSCKAPDGVTCDSVSGVYANAVANNLPVLRRATLVSPQVSPAAPAPAQRRAVTVGTPPTSVELRSPPRVLRLWFKPWEDADHDLYDQGYIYVQVDSGRWQIDHVQRHIRDGYLTLKAPPRAETARGGDPQSASRAPQSAQRPADVVVPGARPSTTVQDTTEPND